MEYRKKVVFLSCVVAALALAYVATLVLNPAARGERADFHAWLKPGDANRIDGISITGPYSDGAESVTLTRLLGKWYVARDGRSYPARATLVNDLIAELSGRAPYPVRATSAAAHARLSLTLGDATRVVVSGGIGPNLLDLLVGRSDPSGRGVYLRRTGENEVRLGEDKLSLNTLARPERWYNLLFFPENESGMPQVQDVMRLTVSPPADGTGNRAAPMIFTRAARSWDVNFEIEAVNSLKVDSLVRDILMGSGDAFADAEGTVFDGGNLTLEFAGGDVTTIDFSLPDERGMRIARVSGGGLAYSVTGWMYGRLFPSPETFSL
jgi:hypothetical protein